MAVNLPAVVLLTLGFFQFPMNKTIQLFGLGHPDRCLPHILSLRLPDVVGETLMTRCDARGVAFSIGSACHGAEEPKKKPKGAASKKPANHVLAAIGMDVREAREVVRLSFCGETTVDDAEDAADIVVEEALRLRDAAPPKAAKGDAAKHKREQGR